MKITVIGAGPGGYEAAIYAAKKGAQVTLIEKGKVGGTCLNMGCIPTKALLASGDALYEVEKAKDFGILTEGVPAPDQQAIIARKDKVVSALVKGVEQLLDANGVALLRGTARIQGPGRVTVQTETGPENVDADAIILATGSVPAVPGFIPYDGKGVITSDEFLSLDKMPAALVIVGGGVIGCEMGQYAARMGGKVTIVEMLPHLLPQEDEDTAAALERRFRRDKIKVMAGVGIAEVQQTEGGVRAVLADGTALDADMLLVSTGRRPYTEGLGLQEAGIKTDEKGFVPVDGTMQTAVPGIYAIGDIVPTPQLAHVAAKEGFVAVDNILGNKKEMDYRAVPRCVYTAPEVAAVGSTEMELTAQGRAYKAGRFDNIALGKAKAAGKTEGFVKVLTDAQDIVVGAAIVGAHATDMLQLLTTAVQLRLTAAELGGCIFPHPTMSEGVMEALHDLHGESIHKP